MTRNFALCLAAVATLSLAAAPVFGDEIKRSTYDRYDDRPTVNSGPLNVREEPSTRARVLTQVRPGDEVVVLERFREITIGDRTGHWVFIATPQCVNDSCERVIAGWVVDFYLDYPEES